MEFNDFIHIYLIRHGMTEFNVQKRYMGYTDEPVIPERLQEYVPLREVFKKSKIDSIYSSDLIRCQQTADFLFGNPSMHLDKRLREIDFGDWEGKTYEQLKDIPAYCNWLSNWETESIPNGESGPVFRERVMQFVNTQILIEELVNHKVAIVSHGGVIRHIVAALCDNVDYWDVHVDFAKAIVLNVKKAGGVWTCTSLSVVPIAEKDNS